MPDAKKPAPGSGEAAIPQIPRPGAWGGKTTAPSCPICGRPAIPEQRPFCSARCRQIDLSHWLTGRYSIPGESLGEEEPED
ncbi:DNA gyrase inhibitor YacG [Roseomonas elaeocarpi]|uniref:DNA gyrase inhibitor YacG n=1 Tax=Roseomonas elaeocarpi TaxID=907779 RepID=A0ABV6JWF8_9PROT